MSWLMVETFLINLLENGIKTYEKIKKILTGQGDNNTTDFLIIYHYFKIKYELIAIDLSKQ